MDKTVVVEVERTVRHPRYHRYIKRRSRFMAHDETEAASMGDRVSIEETRPLSKRKRWTVREVLRKAEA
jgi:small subunit ribosomal protein S17